MSVNLTALSQVALTAQTLNNLILVTPQSNIGFQPASEPTKNFLFHYEGEQSLVLDTDITDHFIEKNTSLQDHIAIKPMMYTTRGFIGELNDVVPPGLELLKIAADKLTILSAYTPSLTVTALIAYNTAVQAAALVASATQAVSKWGSVDSQNKQQVAFQLLQGYQKNRVLFTVQTPWRTCQNMALKTLRPTQTDDTNVITEFECTFKEMNFAGSTTATIAPIGQGRWNQQSAAVVDLGNSPAQFYTTSPTAWLP